MGAIAEKNMSSKTTLTTVVPNKTDCLTVLNGLIFSRCLTSTRSELFSLSDFGKGLTEGNKDAIKLNVIFLLLSVF